MGSCFKTEEHYYLQLVNVLFLDLKHINKKITKEAIESVMDNAVFVKGREVGIFEEGWSKIQNASHCISTSNGTESLFIALKMLGIQKDDQVITPAFSWISSSETISLSGAKPVFVDIHPDSYTIDPDLVESKITSQTRAIIAVHLYGQAAHVAEISALCKMHNLFLIEDCAQAHLTEEHGKYAGTFGDAGAFSFYPTKNLGAYGDAGCIITNNDELAEKMRRFANHGALEKDDHMMEGLNSRMDTLQAAVLLAKLPYLKAWNEQRILNAKLYDSLLADIREIKIPYVRPNTKHTFHIYAIRAKRRNELKDFLASKGVQTIIHYPKSLPNLPAYQYLKHRPEDFPVASLFQEETLSLPIYPELTPQHITYVCQSIKEFYSNKQL